MRTVEGAWKWECGQRAVNSPAARGRERKIDGEKEKGHERKKRGRERGKKDGQRQEKREKEP